LKDYTLKHLIRLSNGENIEVNVVDGKLIIKRLLENNAEEDLTPPEKFNPFFSMESTFADSKQFRELALAILEAYKPSPSVVIDAGSI
jgi:hypothetical protein